MQDSEEYGTIRTVARLTGVPERTLRRWATQGKVPTIEGEAGQLIRVADAVAAAQRHGRPTYRQVPPVAEPRPGGGHTSLTPHSGAESAAADTAGHFLARIEQHYHEQLTQLEQSHTSELERLEALYRARLSDKDTLIEELRRRAESAEQMNRAGQEEETEEPLELRPWWDPRAWFHSS